jgi:branched-chain amino acid transport system ATP-binding protein
LFGPPAGARPIGGRPGRAGESLDGGCGDGGCGDDSRTWSTTAGGVTETDGLEADEVTVTFGGITALDSVSLAVPPNQIVGVIGPNGAGKTTLFNVICGFVTADSGRITYRGRSMNHHKPHDLAGLGIARTLQGVGLWTGLTVVDNVIVGGQARVRVDLGSALLGLGRSWRQERLLRYRAMSTLDRLGIAEHADRLPGELPYAIQKRVSLARALMQQPSLLLVDEPASGLSSPEIDELRTMLTDLRQDMAVLLVEHHMDLVMSTCDHLVVLNFGRVIASATPEVIRSDPEVTRAYLGEEVDTGA